MRWRQTRHTQRLRHREKQRKRSVLTVSGPSTIKILPVLSISGPSTIKILPVLSMRGPSIIKILPILTMSGPSTTHRGDNYKASLLSNTPSEFDSRQYFYGDNSAINKSQINTNGTTTMGYKKYSHKLTKGVSTAVTVLLRGFYQGQEFGS